MKKTDRVIIAFIIAASILVAFGLGAAIGYAFSCLPFLWNIISNAGFALISLMFVAYLYLTNISHNKENN